MVTYLRVERKSWCFLPDLPRAWGRIAQDCGSQTTDSGAINRDHLRHCPWPLGRVASPYRRFLPWGQCRGWAGPCGSYSRCRIHFSKNHEGTLRSYFCYSQVLEGTQCAEGHTVRPRVECADLGFCLD